MMNAAAATYNVTGIEVASIEGRDLVTLVINGQTFRMSAAVAKAVAGDLNRRAKIAKAGA